MKLVIVESPAKARTIKKYLGSKYKVMASQGHLIDLPRSKIGVDIENNFEPAYITIRGKGKILKELKEAGKKADQIFLAADPDREGEAICWHISRALQVEPDKPCRVEFNEITKSAVKDAFKKPRLIDHKRVDAQQTRRILDRIVGYQISPLLWRNIRGGLSAGRVQSVALRLVCEREKEIDNFNSEEYWSLDALLKAEASDSSFKAALDRFRQKKVELKTGDQATEVIKTVQNEQFIVDRITKSQRKRRPLAPFTTSSMQQEASSKLGFTGRKTMTVAQQLYEGINIGSGETVGLVTYIRTDSTRISSEAQAEVRALITEKYGPTYLPESLPVYKKKQGAQEAHEAIRPTSVYREPSAVQQYLNRDQLRLYRLIWNRLVASQMKPALYDQVKAAIKAGEYSFKANGSTLRFAGHLVVSQGTDQNKETVLPELTEGQELTLVELLPEQHFTQPPPRYNEASLIKTLEEKGIGRPSTYSPIIETIQSRGYVIKENKAFVPTELGFVVVELMVKYFPEVIDIDFTARLEMQLDEIAEGKQAGLTVLKDFYEGYFRERITVADQMIEKVELTPEISDETCPQCDKQLVYKHGRFGRFLACPGYPECRFTKKIVKEIGVNCPLDDAMLVERRTKKGRIFYGCRNYPECAFTIWNKPLPINCPQCDSLITESGRGKKKVFRCTNKECGYKKSAVPETEAAHTS